ncbi:hypothetical protein SAMN04487916_105165 [Arthrobacter sp. ov407]|nr:hypothetical protein SAMN04487916_105165 [Arthrobacter sp. ov407]
MGRITGKGHLLQIPHDHRKFFTQHSRHYHLNAPSPGNLQEHCHKAPALVGSASTPLTCLVPGSQDCFPEGLRVIGSVVPLAVDEERRCAACSAEIR